MIRNNNIKKIYTKELLFESGNLIFYPWTFSTGSHWAYKHLQQPQRMWWIFFIRTSKSNIFQCLRKSVREKQPGLLAKCCCDACTWYERTRLTHFAALRVHHLKAMIYSSKSSHLFDPMGSWSRSGGKAGLPKCVFAIRSLPFLLLLLFC